VSIGIVNDLPIEATIPLGLLIVVPFFLLHWFPSHGLMKYPSPRSETTGELSFSCPLVPTIPLLGIAVNVYMASNLRQNAYFMYAGWMVVGFAFYLGYGVKHSRLSKNEFSPLLSEQRVK